jgi:hypothetical protein
MMKTKKPVFELICISYALLGTAVETYVLTAMDYYPDWLRGGQPGGIVTGTAMLAVFVGMITFLVNVFRKTYWFWWCRLIAVFVSFFMLLLISSRM